PIAVAQSAEKAAGIVIRAAQVGSFQHRFFSRRPETEGEGGIFNTLLRPSFPSKANSVTLPAEFFTSIRLTTALS
ncbi:MAG: hypothetical protein ROZ37_08510, partial [Aromatoleum sp.]|uniref:hypothetical protein n=1 Tax=Aromatoleum sp. TaxID=2307007 RepID=UPI002895C48C